MVFHIIASADHQRAPEFRRDLKTTKDLSSKSVRRQYIACFWRSSGSATKSATETKSTCRDQLYYCGSKRQSITNPTLTSQWQNGYLVGMSIRHAVLKPIMSTLTVSHMSMKSSDDRRRLGPYKERSIIDRLQASVSSSVAVVLGNCHRNGYARLKSMTRVHRFNTS